MRALQLCQPRAGVCAGRGDGAGAGASLTCNRKPAVGPRPFSSREMSVCGAAFLAWDQHLSRSDGVSLWGPPALYMSLSRMQLSWVLTGQPLTR